MDDANRSQGVLKTIQNRSSCRHFSPDPVPKSVILNILEAARQAPSGANRQPWRLVVVRQDTLRSRVRQVCEEAETHYHEHLTGPLRGWLADQKISSSKAFLEEAPVLIAVFYDPKAPYAVPSICIAISFMMLAAQDAGYATLPYTPPGPKLHGLLNVEERMNLAAVIPVGLCSKSTRKPRKPLSEIATWI